MDPSTRLRVFWVCPAVHRRLRRCGTGWALHMLRRTWDEFMVQIWCSLQGLIVEKNLWNMIWMINKEVHVKGKWNHIHEAGLKQRFFWRLVNWHLSGPSVTCQSSWRSLLRETNTQITIENVFLAVGSSLWKNSLQFSEPRKVGLTHEFWWSVPWSNRILHIFLGKSAFSSLGNVQLHIRRFNWYRSSTTIVTSWKMDMYPTPLHLSLKNRSSSNFPTKFLRLIKGAACGIRVPKRMNLEFADLETSGQRWLDLFFPNETPPKKRLGGITREASQTFWRRTVTSILCSFPKAAVGPWVYKILVNPWFLNIEPEWATTFRMNWNIWLVDLADGIQYASDVVARDLFNSNWERVPSCCEYKYRCL